MSFFRGIEPIPETDPETDANNLLALEAIRPRPLLSINCTDFVLAHSKGAPLRPVRQLSEVILLPHILEMMHKLHLNHLLRVQSHTWPHLIVDRGHGAMVVAAPRSGRTLSYLPPVCDVISRTIMDTENLLGALAVILVKDLDCVRHVSAVCHAFLRKLKHAPTYTLVLNIPSDNNPEFFRCLFNGVGCLVATPAQLVWMFKDMENLMKFKHLKFIVYDDIDLMDPMLLTKAELVLKNLMLMDHSHPQLVIISQTYDPVQMARLKLLNSNPVLIFGDMLEAALYGKTRLRITICPQQKKFHEVLKTLEQRPPREYRTVIFCSDDADMRHLVYLLEKKENSFSCLPYYEDANLEVGEQVQGWLANTQGIILLATDNCPELSIRNAHTLIHYSMSLSWGKFKLRHLAISGNLVNRLVSSDDVSSPTTLQPHSLILLDESNQKQLPRLVDFVGKHHQPVDEEIKVLAKKIREKFAKLEANQNVVCRQIMMLGDCINKQCEERHHADHAMDRPLDTVPTLGDIKVRLVRVYSPTHLCVHLLEHLPPGESWKPYPSLAAQQMRLQLLQSNCSIERFWPPIAGNICLYRKRGAISVRVRVLKVAPIEDVKLCLNNVNVLVQAMDEDTQIFSVRSGCLYKCPDELQGVPPLAIDLRLFGLIPKSGERDWSEKDRRDIEYKLKNLPSNGCFLQATIQFATSHTIFVSNLVAMFYASAMKMHIRKLSLGQHLIKANLAKSCPLAKDTIFTFFEEVLEVKEGDDKQKLKAEEQLKEENNNETEEHDPPNKTFMQGRALSVIQMGLDQVKLDMLAKARRVKETPDEAAKNVEQEEKAKKPEQVPKDPENQSANPEQAETNKSLNQLIQCIENIKNIAKLEAKEDDNYMFADTFTGATKLLDNWKGYPEVTNKDKPQKKIVKKNATKDSISKFTRDPTTTMQLQLPSNVVRPPTNYYQTLTTLELQVLLPDEGYKYSALLINNQVLFQATHPSLQLCHAFQLPLGVAYSYLKDYMRGRTVYMSVKKTVAMPDPLNFDLYQRFLKPHHEKFGQMDEQQEKKPNKAVPFKDVGWHNEYQENEDSADEDHHVDGIERGEYDLYDED